LCERFFNHFSFPFVAAQPPGVPEICKKSLVSSPVDGGLELFVIGKNFLKDTKVVFQKRKSSSNTINLLWEEAVVPEKEYLQQVCICAFRLLPPFSNQFNSCVFRPI
jgi:nuclear factor of activated T-cells 5